MYQPSALPIQERSDVLCHHLTSTLLKFCLKRQGFKFVVLCNIFLACLLTKNIG